MENFETYRLEQTGQQTQAIIDQVSTNTADIAQLRALYEVLTQSEPVIIQPADTWPVADPQENVIYRVIDRVNTPPQSYSDYMWNGTAMVLMATYNNSIDNEPTPGSNNLVKSGGVAASIVFDISAYHATGSTLATYANLAAALGTDGANVPSAVRKGGMSVKFVQSSDNKYVQYFLNKDEWSSSEADWDKLNLKFIPDSGIIFYKNWNFDYVNPQSMYINTLTSPIIVKSGSYLELDVQVDILIAESGASLVSFWFKDTNNNYYEVQFNSPGHKHKLIKIEQDIQINKYGISTYQIETLQGNCVYNANFIADTNKKFLEIDLDVNSLNDRESLVTSIVDTKALAKDGQTNVFTGYVVNNVKFAGNGIIKKLFIYSPTNNNTDVKIFTCYQSSFNSESGATFVTKQVYSYELSQGLNEIDVNISVDKGDFLGLYCGVIESFPPFSDSQTNGWWWNVGSVIPPTPGSIQQETLYLPNYSLAYGFFGYTIKPTEEESQTTTIVVERNQADYNSIREIINNIADASEKHKYIVYVPNGEYFESDLQGKDYVEIVGQDRDKTILYCDGTSSNLTPDGYAYGPEYSNVPLNSLARQYKHVFFVNQNCKVKNLTIKANDCKYCVHLDSSTYENAIFENCVFLDVANNNFPVGIGMHSGQEIDLINCIFRSLQDDTIGIFAHNWNNQDKPTKLLVKDCLFDNCSFANIDELGSEQNDEWYIINCFSTVGGYVNFMVDINSNGTTYWTNPATGEKEPDPRLVPYCIKLNCLGSNVLSCLQSHFNGTQVQVSLPRPEFAKYLVSEHYIKIPKGTYQIGSVVRKIMKGNVLSDAFSNILGIIEYIIDDYAYVARDTAWIYHANISGTPSVGSDIYEDANGCVTTISSDKKIGKIISLSVIGYYQIFIF